MYPTPVCVSVFPFVPKDLADAYASMDGDAKERGYDPFWYPWDVSSGYMFRFPNAEQADRLLTQLVEESRDAFGVTKDIRPYLFGNFQKPRFGENRSAEATFRGVWVVAVRRYGSVRLWHTNLTSGTDPYHISLPAMCRIAEDDIRAGSVAQFLTLTAIG